MRGETVMATVPTGRMELELRRLYFRWLHSLGDDTNMDKAVDRFEKQSIALIDRLGGQAASLGALAGFPVPKRLDLSPHVGTIYSDMKQAAIQAGIQAGLNASTVARAMFRNGMDKSYHRLNRLARTETVSAYWKNSWDSIEGLDLVMVWSSETGPRTCDYCLSRDGLVVEDRNVRDHPNGRCTLLPTLASQVKYKGTLQPDGSVTQDPKWGAPAIVVQDYASMTEEDKARAAEIMFGTDSPQYRRAAEAVKADRIPASKAGTKKAIPVPVNTPAPKPAPKKRPSTVKKNPIEAKVPTPTKVTDYRDMSGEDKITAAAVMFGYGSKQHKAAIKRWRK